MAREGFTVLNGLAIGVDAYASEGAVEAKGKVVAVMPGGLYQMREMRTGLSAAYKDQG